MTFTKEQLTYLASKQLFTARQSLWNAVEQLTEAGLHAVAAQVTEAYELTKRSDEWLAHDTKESA